MDEGLSTTSPAAIFEATSSGSMVILRFKSKLTFRVKSYVPSVKKKILFPHPDNPDTRYPVFTGGYGSGR